MGEPTRLRILEALSAGPMCVCTLRDHTGLGGPLMSHHLSVLREAGLVTATDEDAGSTISSPKACWRGSSIAAVGAGGARS